MPKKLSTVPPDVGARFKEFREARGLSQGVFAQMMGLTQASLSRMEAGKGPVSAELIYNFACQFPGVDVRQLLCGQPSSLSVSQIAANITPVIRPITKPINGIPDDASADDYFAVPLVEGRVAAGPGGFLWEQVESLVWVYQPELGNRRNLIAVKVAGDSMYPTVPDGAIVIVDLDRRDPRGDRRNIWAIRTDQEGAVAIKRLQILKGEPGYLVLSDNFNAYPPEVAWTKEPSKLVVGQVVWMWRSLA